MMRNRRLRRHAAGLRAAPVSRVLVVTGLWPTDERPHFGTFVASQMNSVRALGIEVDLVVPRRGPMLWRYVWASVQVAARAWARHYDVIHAHFGMWGWAARAQCRYPVVVSFCGNDVLGHPGEPDSDKFTYRLTVWASRCLARVVDGVIVKSDAMGRALQGAPYTVIPNGVDFSVFYPDDQDAARRSLGLAADRKYVLFVGDPAEYRKRYDLADAAVAAAAAGMDVAVELIVVFGRQPAEVATFMRAADALILTSVTEGSPNVVKEAMACNLSVIATDVGDVREVIGGVEGCAIIDPDPGGASAALMAILSRGGRTTGRDYLANLTLERVAERVLAVYASAAARTSHRKDGPPCCVGGRR